MVVVQYLTMFMIIDFPNCLIYREAIDPKMQGLVKLLRDRQIIS